MTSRNFTAFITSVLASMAGYTPLRLLLISARGCAAYGSEVMVVPLIFIIFWVPLHAYADREDMKEWRRARIMKRVRRSRSY